MRKKRFFVKAKKESRCELPEARAEAALASLMPRAAAKWLSVEMIILASALKSLALPFRKRTATGFSYAVGTTFALIPLLILLVSPADLLVTKELLHLHSSVVNWLLIGVDCWSVLWTYGIYVTMRDRPHQVDGQELRVYCGILGHSKIPLALIGDMLPVEEPVWPKEAASKRDKDNATRLTVPGVPRVRLELKQPVEVNRLWVGKKLTQTLIVSANDGKRLIQSIRSHATGLESFCP